MKNMDMETIKEVWKSDRTNDRLTLSDEEILSYLRKRSKGISGQFRKGLYFDIIYKAMILLSAFILVGLFAFLPSAGIPALGVAVAALAGIIYQGLLLRKIPLLEGGNLNIKASLSAKIEFYHRHYVKSLFISALSASLFFISGSLYYYLIKYGEIPALQLDDYIVFGILLILSFSLSAFAQVKQFNFQLRQLEGCLEEMDGDDIQRIKVDYLRGNRKKRIIIFSLAILLGLLVLFFLLYNISPG